VIYNLYKQLKLIADKEFNDKKGKMEKELGIRLKR
jgi:hypothetical protein